MWALPFDEPRYSEHVAKAARKVRLLIMDVDGVLTDGALIYDHAGRELKSFHAHDGHGLTMLQENHIELGIITGRRSSVLAKRAADLHIQALYQGQRDKREAFTDCCKRFALEPEQTAFMGDDVMDVPLLRRAGLGLTVPTAHPMAKSYADWCSTVAGGFGAVRQAAELLLHAQDRLQATLQRQLD